MSPAYENAVRTIAEAYTSQRGSFGGRSLARIATIVTNNGSFFVRVASGKTFSVANLEKVAAWFRDPANWPNGSIPHAAAIALASIGRPPLDAAPCGVDHAFVDCDRPHIPQRPVA